LLIVIFAEGSESPLTEFRQLQNLLQIEKLKQMRLTTSLSNFIYVSLVLAENSVPFFHTYIQQRGHHVVLLCRMFYL